MNFFDEAYNIVGQYSLHFFIFVLLLIGFSFAFYFTPVSFFKPTQFDIVYEVIFWVWIGSGAFSGVFYIFKKFRNEKIRYFPFTAIPFAIALFLATAYFVDFLNASNLSQTTY